MKLDLKYEMVTIKITKVDHKGCYVKLDDDIDWGHKKILNEQKGEVCGKTTTTLFNLLCNLSLIYELKLF